MLYAICSSPIRHGGHQQFYDFVRIVVELAELLQPSISVFRQHDSRSAEQGFWCRDEIHVGTRAYQPTAEDRTAQCVPEAMSKNPINGVETIVRDGRGLNMTLGAHSFALKRTISDLGGLTWISG